MSRDILTLLGIAMAESVFVAVGRGLSFFV